MQPIATDDPVACCFPSAFCLAATLYKTAERIEVLVVRGGLTETSGPETHNGGPDRPTAKGEEESVWGKILPI